MELRPKLSQYEERYFLSLVEAIWHADFARESCRSEGGAYRFSQKIH